MREIGETIEQLRAKLAMSQTQFGKVFKISAMSVSRWERGANLPDARLLLKLGLLAKRQQMDGWRFWQLAGITKTDARAAFGKANTVGA